MSCGSTHAVLRLHLATLHHGDLGQRLLERFGSADEVFRRSSPELREVEGMTRRSLERLNALEPGVRAEKELRRCRRQNVSLLVYGTPSYPVSLAGLPYLPLVLFCLGDLKAEDALAVAIVGSRRPSAYGLRQARRFARELSMRGVTVVSGLARGVDGAAQQAALEAGGRTVAVLGSGLGRIYPPEHGALAQRIAAGDRGALISEFPCDTPPKSFHFPRRNRLLSGLSAIVFVVEAGERSGSLITVDWALRQGKSVYALPGRVDQPQASGVLGLLRDGASPAISPEDLFDGLGLGPLERDRPETSEATVRPIPGPLGEGLSRLFAEEDVWYADSLAERLEFDLPALLAELSRLEVEGYIRRDPGGGYVV